MAPNPGFRAKCITFTFCYSLQLEILGSSSEVGRFRVQYTLGLRVECNPQDGEGSGWFRTSRRELFCRWICWRRRLRVCLRRHSRVFSFPQSSAAHEQGLLRFVVSHPCARKKAQGWGTRRSSLMRTSLIPIPNRKRPSKQKRGAGPEGPSISRSVQGPEGPCSLRRATVDSVVSQIPKAGSGAPGAI